MLLLRGVELQQPHKENFFTNKNRSNKSLGGSQPKRLSSVVLTSSSGKRHGAANTSGNSKRNSGSNEAIMLEIDSTVGRWALADLEIFECQSRNIHRHEAATKKANNKTKTQKV
jgi:hypothetical protein